MQLLHLLLIKQNLTQQKQTFYQ